MIKIGIRGGLGNQLFQTSYANFCKVNGLEVSVVDLNLFYKRHSETDVINLGLIEHLGIKQQQGNRFLFYASKLLGCENRSLPYLYELGYFQNSKFLLDNFVTASSEVLGLYTAPKHDVVCHIRGGDYLSDRNKQRYDVINFQAISDLQQLLQKKFTIITNDNEYSSYIMAKYHIHGDIVNGSSELVDLGIFANAKARIAANSTFSLWGHFLSSSGSTYFPTAWDAKTKTVITKFKDRVFFYG